MEELVSCSVTVYDMRKPFSSFEPEKVALGIFGVRFSFTLSPS